jgi:hypothetical protein
MITDSINSKATELLLIATDSNLWSWKLFIYTYHPINDCERYSMLMMSLKSIQRRPNPWMLANRCNYSSYCTLLYSPRELTIVYAGYKTRLTPWLFGSLWTFNTLSVNQLTVSKGQVSLSPCRLSVCQSVSLTVYQPKTPLPHSWELLWICSLLKDSKMNLIYWGSFKSFILCVSRCVS